MPLVIDAQTDRKMALEELVDLLEREFDPDDEEGMAAFGMPLRRLANDHRFLGDLVIEELKRHCSSQSERNHYSSQVILLHGQSKKFLIRANFWPAQQDSVMVNSGSDPFFYGLPHDHNFSFLTVGYLGPGYWSDYYECDGNASLGFPGEKVDLRFVERSRLSQGKVMLYRRHRDVHSQLPPDSLSVSINILAISPTSEFRDQYRFDTGRSEIGGIINASGLETLVRLSAHYGGGNGADLVDTFARTHPSERIRFAAYRARAEATPDCTARAAIYEAAAREPGQLGMLARAALARLDRVRPWFEAKAPFSSLPESSG
jgi:hypothetical protein